MAADWIAGFFLVILIAWLFVFFACLKWVGKVAKRNHRSVSGFKWLFFFSPLVAWAILLTIDKRTEGSSQ